MRWLVVFLIACTGPADFPEPVPLDLHDRPFDEIALLVAHNAMNSTESGFLVPNQALGYEAQLNLGVRGFMLDVVEDDGIYAFCHADCTYGSEPLVDGFARFAVWLDTHPDEVIVFILQDDAPPEPILDALVASGLDQLAITPIDGPWPSWNALVAGNTRVLITTENTHDDVPPWYASTYGLAWDNPYSAETVDDFGCELLRGDPNNPIFLLNHFLTNPIGSASLSEQANTKDAIEAHIEACEDDTGRPVTWLALDYVDIGAGIEVVAALNEL